MIKKSSASLPLGFQPVVGFWRFSNRSVHCTLPMTWSSIYVQCNTVRLHNIISYDPFYKTNTYWANMNQYFNWYCDSIWRNWPHTKIGLAGRKAFCNGRWMRVEQNQDGLLELQQSGQRAKCTRFVHPNNARICPPSGAAAHIGKVYIVLLSIVFLGNSVLEVAATETIGWAGKKEWYGVGGLWEQRLPNKSENKTFKFPADLQCFESWVQHSSFLVLRGGWVCLREQPSINHRVKVEPNYPS